MIRDDAPAETEPTHRFGGRPLVSKDSEVDWPCCKQCNLPMLFAGQLLVPAHDVDSQNLILMFMCDKSAEDCMTWNPEYGGIHAILVPVGSEMTFQEPPSAKGCLRNITYGAKVMNILDEGFFPARNNFVERINTLFENVLGYLFGEPDWLEYDQTPQCVLCRKSMRFVAMLSQGPGDLESLSFGLGYAYLFDCACGTAKFLWQC